MFAYFISSYRTGKQLFRWFTDSVTEMLIAFLQNTELK